MSHQQPLTRIDMAPDETPGVPGAPDANASGSPQPAPKPGETDSTEILPVDPANAETRQAADRPTDGTTASAEKAAPTPPVAVPLVDDAKTTDSYDDPFLDDLELPSLVSAPEPLASGARIGPDECVQVGELRGTRGRVNLYAATWRREDGKDAAIELREGPTDHPGLRREAEILASVQYAMLPRWFGAWDEDARQYLAVEPADGETLRRALATGPTVEQALSIVVQLAQAVRRLHRAGWALLGLTPDDVSLGRPIQIRHLGQAARIGEATPGALQVPGYSAPELASREPVSGSEDVYTLGAILYEALAGHRLEDAEAEASNIAMQVRVPGGPQLLVDALAPADERPDMENLYRRLLALKERHSSTSPSLEVASATTLGLNPTRTVNEDSSCYAVWARTGADGARETALLCVADGMGGMEAGEVASQTAVAVLMRGAITTLWPPPSVGGPAAPVGAETTETDPAQASAQEQSPNATAGSAGPRLDPAALVRQAATAVHTAGQGRDLGTTITCVTVHDGELTLAHVGDTRAYLLRDGALIRLTADHSLVAAMVASGVITPDEARGHPDSNKVLRSLGSQRVLPPGYVDGLEAAYGQPGLHLMFGDVLLICSDGVWGTVEDREIQAVLAEALDAQIAARALVDRAIAGGAPDNATAVVARCVQRPVL